MFKQDGAPPYNVMEVRNYLMNFVRTPTLEEPDHFHIPSVPTR